MSYFILIVFFRICTHDLFPDTAIDSSWSSWGPWGSCSKTCVGLDLVEGVRQLMDVDVHLCVNCQTLRKYKFINHNLQTRSRSRSCNVAQHGGSTATCTTAETETQLCNSRRCDGKFQSQCKIWNHHLPFNQRV